MPTPYLNKVSKETNIPVLKLEELWESSKIDADKTITKKDNLYWGLVTTIFKKKVNKLLKDENKPAIENFFTDLKELPNFITEDNNTVGDVHLESELCFIAYMNTPEGLSKADRITEIEQYVLKTDKPGEVRVRRSKQVYPKEELLYHVTIKKNVSKSAITVAYECNEKTNEAFYDSFKVFSTNYSKKVRYTFRLRDIDIKVTFKNESTTIKVPSLEYEVDVYSEGNVIHDWVKIDIELDHLAEYIKYVLRDHDFSLDDCEIEIPMNILPITPINYFNINNPETELNKKIKDALYQKGIFNKKINIPAG